MIVTIHQAAYLPWLGYLARIARSDVFVFLDTVQFEKNSFTNRNKIKTAAGPIWLTVPVSSRGHMSKRLLDVEIDSRRDWRKKHRRSIEMNYRRAANFERNIPKLETLYGGDEHLLADLCFNHLQFWLRELEIDTRVVRASTLHVEGRKSDLVLQLCKHLGATTYLSGPRGRDYLAQNDFAASGVDVVFYEFKHPVYPQLYGEFLPAMSVVDYWMNANNGLPFRKKP